MKTFMGVALFGLSLILAACSTNPRAVPAEPTAHAKPVPHQSEAQTGFDNLSNAIVDDRTHQADQANFEQFKAISDGLGPLYNAQSCRECHQSPVTGRRQPDYWSCASAIRERTARFRTQRFRSITDPKIIKGRTLW